MNNKRQENHRRKRAIIKNYLKSKYNLLTLQYNINYHNDIKTNLHEYVEYPIFENIVQPANNKSMSNPILYKSFMFLNEQDIMKKVYESTKDQNIMKRSKEDYQYIINKFMNAINSTEFPIDYIEEDFSVNSDDLSEENYKNLLRLKNKKHKKRSITLNIINKAFKKRRSISNDNIEIQDDNLEWGLDRIDQRQTTGDNIYKYQKNAGRNVNVYIIDTGLNFNHKDYKSRCYHGANFVDNESDDDLYGHGSYVAGIVGGEIHGVAKKVNLISVKVLNKNGSGKSSTVIQGLYWVINNHKNNRENNIGSIANISLGSIKSNALNDAVSIAKKNGILVITSAGNDGGDACNKSPASSKDVISVGAIDKDDHISLFSNRGSCVSIYAPGEDISSSSNISSNSGIKYGTSFSTPFVSGVAALMMSELYNYQQNFSPDRIKNILLNIATNSLTNGDSITQSNNAMIYEYNFENGNRKDSQDNKQTSRIDVFSQSNPNNIYILYNGWNYGFTINNTISSITNFTMKSLSLKEFFQNFIIIYCILLLSYILFL
ncbi:subtilisin-like protein [Piromyces finnis]|uniref:Subtilisin-like protein n=1 Tax=Piromyces finnis TaxID=1754191 RepID=A0A1Y1VHZ7_9FUNG|nr:subtilisin-like protein [Piromyces finnis]|eukprot:ORX55401.1 subtilisin-like protein [Piromyces finnis]